MTGNAVGDWALGLCGVVVTVIFVIRAIGHYGKAEWGSLITHIIASIVLLGIVFATDTTIDLLTGIWNAFNSDSGIDTGGIAPLDGNHEAG